MVVFVLRRLCWLPEQRLRSQATARDMNTLILTQLTLMTSQLGILIFYPARTARGQAGPQNEWCNTVRVSCDCHVTVMTTWALAHCHWTLHSEYSHPHNSGNWHKTITPPGHLRCSILTSTYIVIVIYTIFHLFHTSNLRLSAQSSLTGCTQSGHQ